MPSEDIHAQLHRAAAQGDAPRVTALLAAGADPSLSLGGRLPWEQVFIGNVSCDPEDVAAWRWLREHLRVAAAQVAAVQVSGPEARAVAVWVGQNAPSPVQNGGGTLHAVVQTTEPPSWVVVSITGDFRGTNPAADGPWGLRAVVRLRIEDGIAREAVREEWSLC